MEVDIEPKSEALDSLGLSREEFEHALMNALDRLDGKPRKELPVPSDIRLCLRGLEHRLGDLARIDVLYASGQRATL